MIDMVLHGSGLGWHGPISVVGAPSRSDGYGVVAPPRIWSRGIPNAAHCITRTGSYSDRMVSNGSTRAALAAGTQHAARATTARSDVDARYVTRSVELMP